VPIIHIRFSVNISNIKTLIKFQEIIVNTYQIKYIAKNSNISMIQEHKDIKNEKVIIPSSNTTLDDIVTSMKFLNINKIRIDDDILNVEYKL
jgi:hypothetical protein